MRVNEIEVRVGLTINLGNYESARVDVGAKGSLEEGDDRRASYKELFDMCAIEIKDEVAKINSQVAERFRSSH